MNKHSAISSMDPDYPLANSQATRMLAEALARANEERNLSQRQLAKILNYKTSVVLSHMALGRVPIPVDRALDFARLLNMDAPKFLLAVLEQRHPDIDFGRTFGISTKSKPVSVEGRESYTLEELESIAGKPLDELPVDRINILREAVADPNASRRWLDLGELQLMEAIRAARPSGLSPVERRKVADFIRGL